MSPTVWATNTPTALKAYGSALVELAEQRPEIVCIGADLTGPTETDMFRDAIPERFFNVGMAEANAIGVAAGLARAGEIPFVNTFAVFASRRAFDQIAMQVAYPRTNVKIAGFMPGLTTPGGVTHQAIEDLALMRALPNMTVVEPADANQICAAVASLADHHGPVYMRLKRGEVPVMSATADQAFQIGRSYLVREGSDAVVFACGLMVTLALDAAEALAGEGCSVAVVNVSTIKPLDSELITELAAQTGHVVTAENHSIIGGLGSAVAETLIEAGVRCSCRRVGIRDTFAEGASAAYLFEKYGLTTQAIVDACHATLDQARTRAGQTPA
jgi:transketolase